MNRSQFGVLCLCVLTWVLLPQAASAKEQQVPLYAVFEQAVINEADYPNKFTDVELQVQYIAPSGKLVNFFGFFDGNGDGGGNAQDGKVWKMRFMPNELGSWQYVYQWSDGRKGGKGRFECVAEGAGKGVLQAYSANPHWMAYNGSEPVWLKSYYETGHGSLGQDFNWIVSHVYQPLVDHGYNHLQVNWLLSLCCFDQYYLDGPEPETLDLALYEEAKVTETMKLDVWRRMEQHLSWLNDHQVGVHMFLGVDGSQNDGPAWEKLSVEDQRFFVKYMVARLAPYANLAGWNFVWEVPGDREGHELGFARLVQEYDVFKHLRTYEDEFPRENFYHLPEYAFAAVENHEIASPDRNSERHLWRTAWTHHQACLLGYRGKPVFMSEGNALWRRYWQERSEATQVDLRRSAWGCTTAGASFTWNGHAKEYELYAGGESGLPFNPENPYLQSEQMLTVMACIMNEDVAFYRLKPMDKLLKNNNPFEDYLLAEPGEQYLVFSPGGNQFALCLDEGEYQQVYWIDSQSGEKTLLEPITVGGEGVVKQFRTPSAQTDWVLIVKK